MTTYFEAAGATSYPGRGIMAGKSQDGKQEQCSAQAQHTRIISNFHNPPSPCFIMFYVFSLLCKIT